ncbi:hypothetical protein C8A00DRAFT_13372 [Chaetomidium leptoderma]|uniref:Uncharacterized protein n=1 Tax=Chaetomidium leptoderma TaxID=669021 RepID=A0AAN6VPX1_9PEZI|nr:hypothetical protein C8A00DRAFT_13372 [Chaetomidium leptoderma]
MFPDTPFPDHRRKRFREEDEISSGGPVGFTEHRSKRLQSLPFRTSPNSKRWIDRPVFPLSNPTFAMTGQTQAVAPQEHLQEHVWADEPELASPNPSSEMVSGIFDNDMDMMDTSDSLSGRNQPGQGQPGMEPGPFHADHLVPSVTGRIPTPIHCSFAARVRGNSWSGGNPMHGDTLATTPEEPNAAAFNSNGLVDLSSQQPSGATATAIMADWGTVQNRRLPSPISECGGEDSLGSARLAFESASLHGGNFGNLTHEHPLVAGLPPRASSAMEGRLAREGTPAPENQNGSAMDVESPGSPSPKKGHTRSKHTVNSWTALQPGMTRSFSIGYRADCEKCRNKVPGHFNHIIVS